MNKIILSVAVVSTLIMANEPLKDSNYVSHAELGYIETQGNTETKTFNLDANIKKGWGGSKFKLSFDGQYADDSGVTGKSVEIKNKYLVELDYNYEFTDRVAFNWLTGYKQDKFSGFDYQLYTGPGLKYKAVVSEVQNLSFAVNVLYSKDSVEDINYDANGDIISYPNVGDVAAATTAKGDTAEYSSYRVSGLYDWQILENLKFDQELSYRAEIKETDNYFAYSKTALSSKISDMFSAGISYKVDYVNTPPIGKEYSDRTITANLIVDF